VYEVAWGIASFFTSLFQCAPVQSYWFIQSPVRQCLDVSALYYSTSGLNIFTDCTYELNRQEQFFILTADRPSPHIPLAGKRPRIRSDLDPSTHYFNYHVLSWRPHLRRWIVSRMVHFYLRQLLGLPLYVFFRCLMTSLAYFLGLHLIFAYTSSLFHTTN
jgi:hypothetical protein